MDAWHLKEKGLEAARRAAGLDAAGNSRQAVELYNESLRWFGKFLAKNTWTLDQQPHVRQATLDKMMECTKRVEVLESALNLQPTAPPLPDHLAQHGMPPCHEAPQPTEDWLLGAKHQGESWAAGGGGGAGWQQPSLHSWLQGAHKPPHHLPQDWQHGPAHQQHQQAAQGRPDLYRKPPPQPLHVPLGADHAAGFPDEDDSPLDPDLHARLARLLGKDKAHPGSPGGSPTRPQQQPSFSPQRPSSSPQHSPCWPQQPSLSPQHPLYRRPQQPFFLPQQPPYGHHQQEAEVEELERRFSQLKQPRLWGEFVTGGQLFEEQNHTMM